MTQKSQLVMEMEFCPISSHCSRFPVFQWAVTCILPPLSYHRSFVHAIFLHVELLLSLYLVYSHSSFQFHHKCHFFGKIFCETFTRLDLSRRNTQSSIFLSFLDASYSCNFKFVCGTTQLVFLSHIKISKRTGSMSVFVPYQTLRSYSSTQNLLHAQQMSVK